MGADSRLPEYRGLSGWERTYHWLNCVGLPATGMLGLIDLFFGSDPYFLSSVCFGLFGGWTIISGILNKNIRRQVLAWLGGISLPGCWMLLFAGWIMVIIIAIFISLMIVFGWVVLDLYLIITSARALMRDRQGMM